MVTIAPMLMGCASNGGVVRVYDGRVVEGAYVPAQAYAAFLEGALAEEAGDLRSALAAYERAVQEDDTDPEPLTRVGDIRCKLDPKSKVADEALARALRIDRTYAPAIAAQALCAGARGQTEIAVETMNRIATEDRTGTLEALFVHLAAQRGASAADRNSHARALALTIARGESPAAWKALVSWGRSKGDGELVARGYENLVRVAPTMSGEVEAGALELLGLGHTSLARRVAVSIADAPAELGLGAIRDATVARLAIDEALLAGDLHRASRRAVRGHVPLAEVAARALLVERADLASILARNVLSADPDSGGAAMVLAAIAAREGRTSSSAEWARSKRSSDRPAAACVLVFAERLAAAADVESARLWASRVVPAEMAAHDPVVSPLAVDLAARGIIAEASLPLELRLELAARRRETPPAVDVSAIDKNVVDAKHALLWHMLTDPSGKPATTLLSRMSSAAESDPIVGFSLGRAALAAAVGRSFRPEAWAPVLRAIASAPSDPLLLAVAVEVAQQGGHTEDIVPARTRLMAVARTPAERSLASE